MDALHTRTHRSVCTISLVSTLCLFPGLLEEHQPAYIVCTLRLPLQLCDCYATWEPGTNRCMSSPSILYSSCQRRNSQETEQNPPHKRTRQLCWSARCCGLRDIIFPLLTCSESSLWLSYCNRLKSFSWVTNVPSFSHCILLTFFLVARLTCPRPPEVYTRRHVDRHHLTTFRAIQGFVETPQICKVSGGNTHVSDHSNRPI